MNRITLYRMSTPNFVNYPPEKGTRKGNYYVSRSADGKIIHTYVEIDNSEGGKKYLKLQSHDAKNSNTGTKGSPITVYEKDILINPAYNNAGKRANSAARAATSRSAIMSAVAPTQPRITLTGGPSAAAEKFNRTRRNAANAERKKALATSAVGISSSTPLLVQPRFISPVSSGLSMRPNPLGNKASTLVRPPVSSARKNMAAGILSSKSAAAAAAAAPRSSTFLTEIEEKNAIEGGRRKKTRRVRRSKKTRRIRR
jgi:hypothetical protein